MASCSHLRILGIRPLCRSYSQDVTWKSVLSEANRQRCKMDLRSKKPGRSIPWAKGEVDQAAILVPLCTVNGEASLMFTLRTTTLNSHRGQVSFPGGRVDHGDTDRIHTAVREAEEETGLKGDGLELWGAMSPVPGRDFKIAVTPVLAYCGELDINSLSPNPKEVAEVFFASIETLCDPSKYGYTTFENGYSLPVYTGAAHRIWGLTAIILHLTLRLLVPDLYQLKLPASKRKRF